MWRLSRKLAVCVFAAAWWGIFYPELCFSEDTCAVVRIQNAQEEEAESDRAQEEEAGAKNVLSRGGKRPGGSWEIDAADIWRASGDEIVIRSRLWEWCEENLIGTRENQEKSSAEME